MNDLKFALRQLLKNPGFTAVAVLTLGLGIGANTAIFSVVNTVLLNPIPRPVADRLIQIAERDYIQGGFRVENNKPSFNGVSPSEIERLPSGWTTGPNTQAFARLKPDVTAQQTEALLDTVAQRLTSDHTNKRGYIDDWRRRPGGLGFWVRPARQQFTAGRDDLQRTLYGLLVAIGFVLLIVCANIANLTLARTLWPGEEAVGKKFGGRVRRDLRQYQVVGVVGDFRDYKYDQQVRPTFYRPCHELGLEGQRPFFAVRTEIDPRAMVRGIHQELKAAEPEMGKPQILVCRDVLYDSTQARRTYMRYLAVFAGVGLLLSALGIYGVLAFSVVKRTQEIGIRMALGAERRQVLRMILADGVRLIAIGTVVGIVAAYWLMRLVQHQLFGVRPTEPFVFLGAVLLLSTVALLACFVPARRATRIHPMEALRHE